MHSMRSASLLEKEYYSWEIVRVERAVVDQIAPDPALVAVRGDLTGSLSLDPGGETYSGLLEFPGPADADGFYEVLVTGDGQPRVLERIEVRYTFDVRFFAPRWENIDAVHRYLALKHPDCVERHIVYRYPEFGRDIQMLRVTDPLVGEAQKQVVFYSARIHNVESGTTSALFRFVKWLLEEEGSEYLSQYVFLLMPMTIPLTSHEDPRGHDVNREWRVDMAEPDLIAVRDEVIDRYVPEVWIDNHNFNDTLDLKKENALRMESGDYLVGHPVGEEHFDWVYSRDIGRRLIGASEAGGHSHRNEDFFRHWASDLHNRGLARPEEEIVTEHDPAGIFSGRDYARFADRIKYGFPGRDFAAMAGDFGYERCHAINYITETKPTCVNMLRHRLSKENTDKEIPVHGILENDVCHYTSGYQDSAVLKLKEMCRIGAEHHAGHPLAGFPCNAIVSDNYKDDDSVLLFAWGTSYGERRLSRQALWANRRSIIVLRTNGRQDPHLFEITISCVRRIRCNAAVRIPVAEDPTTVLINGSANRYFTVAEGFLFYPFLLEQGRMAVTIELRG